MRTSRRSLLLTVALSLSALTLTGCAESNLVNQVVNFWSLSCCGTIVVILDIIALVELAGSPRSTGSKILWAAIVVFFPILGCFLYYLFGRE